MIWRILLLTYFATGAAWGPTFCCCRVNQLLELAAERIGCCLAVDSASESSRDTFSAGTCPRCRPAVERQAEAPTCCVGKTCCAGKKGGEQADPESSCPCRERGERDSGLWSFAFSGQQLVRSIPWSDFVAVLLSATAESGLLLRNIRDGEGRLLECHPYLLYGRALLRAQQTLNC